jgi:hypothetical protein
MKRKIYSWNAREYFSTYGKGDLGDEGAGGDNKIFHVQECAQFMMATY